MAKEEHTQETVHDEVSESITLFKRIIATLGSEAASIAVFESVSKDRRVRAMNLERQSDRIDLRASSKQINKLRFLGVEVAPGLSKAEASRLIDEAIARAA